MRFKQLSRRAFNTATTDSSPKHHRPSIAINKLSSSRQPSIASLTWHAPSALSLSTYKNLSKAKLSALVVLTTMAGYSMAPHISLLQLAYTTFGTGLCVSSANTFNQWIESAYDAQMARTRDRAIVTRVISPPHAFLAGSILATSGVTLLYTLVNPLVALLGDYLILSLIARRRISIINTWAGAVVGALPPVMGWAAATGSIDPGAVVLGLTLYAWQFPHFNALSWNLRPDYAKAGYRMMSVANEAMNARVALRHTLFLFPLCAASTYINLTTSLFLIDSTLLNLCLLIPAIQFWRASNERTARRLFFASLIHLPVLLALFMIHKQTDLEKDENKETVD